MEGMVACHDHISILKESTALRGKFNGDINSEWQGWGLLISMFMTNGPFW